MAGQCQWCGELTRLTKKSKEGLRARYLMYCNKSCLGKYHSYILLSQDEAFKERIKRDEEIMKKLNPNPEPKTITQIRLIRNGKVIVIFHNSAPWSKLEFKKGDWIQITIQKLEDDKNG